MNRRGVIVALDILAVALIVLAAAIVHTGGFIAHVWEIPVRFRTPARALFWLTVVVVGRLIADRHTPPFGLVQPTADSFRVHLSRGAGRRAMYVSLGMALALAVLLHDQLRHPYSVPELGDPLFSIWRIGWVNHQIVNDPAHLFDANIFYPERLTLTLSDPIILPAFTAAPLLAVGLPPVVVYNLLLFSGFLLSGIATYLLVERLTGSPHAACIAGLMYACYAYRFEHYSHLELQMTHWIPLGLIALHLFVLTGRYGYAIALALAGVAELYSSMYYGVFFLIYAAVIGVGLLAVHRPDVRRMVVPVAACAVLAGVLAVPLIRPFVEAQPAKGERSLGEIALYSAKPSDYLRANAHSAAWRDRLMPSVAERALFPGIMPLALGAVGFAPPFSAVRAVYGVGLLVAYDASLGFNGYVYPYLHRWLPPVRGLRAPARFSAIVGLTLAIFAGFGVLRVLRCCRRKAIEWAVLAVMVAAILADAWPVLALEPVWKTTPSIYERLPATGDVVIAELPVIYDPGYNVQFMYFSVWHWRPMLNGYSGFIPASYDRLTTELAEFPRDETPAVLRAHGATHVIVNCGLRYPGCDEDRALMRRSQGVRFMGDVVWEGAQVELYEIVR
jgi:hypothetical protein